MDPIITQYEALITDETRAAVASLVERTIGREYGHTDPDALAGARMLAEAGMRMDWAVTYYAEHGNTERTRASLDQLAYHQVRIMLAAGLDARRCPCVRGDHGHHGQCEGHSEADVPALGGELYCGGCYIAISGPVAS